MHDDELQSPEDVIFEAVQAVGFLENGDIEELLHRLEDCNISREIIVQVAYTMTDNIL